MIGHLHHRRATFLASLDRHDATGQFDAICNEVFETAGQFCRPDGRLSHLWELTLHGIAATGATEEEAIANWKRLARREVDAADTPRPAHRHPAHHQHEAHP